MGGEKTAMRIFRQVVRRTTHRDLPTTASGEEKAHKCLES